MTARLVLWPDRFWFAAAGLKSGMSRRFAVTILYSLTGEPLQLEFENGKRLAEPAVLIAPQAARSLDASEVAFLSFNLDQLSYEYHALARMLGNRIAMPLAWDGFQPLRRELRGFYCGELDCAESYRVFAEFVRGIGDYRPPNLLVDMRVIHVANRIRTELPLTHTVEELARHVGLSADRLTHLFSEQLGISIRSYILWAKMRRAALLFPTGRPLVEIAHEVGFSDSAHMTHTFKTYFGLTPSFLADSSRVTVRGC